MYMQIKYSGDKPIISQHGITFNTTKEDKYIYLKGAIHILHIIDLKHNYEFDEDAKNISYIFNKRYKDTEVYKCDVKDVMWNKLDEEQTYDVIINTSCEHMYPMSRFYTLNNFNNFPLYVLQSTDDKQWDDHINCVSSPKELAEQAQISDIRYSGTMKLDNGMNRFMVIGYP